MLWDEPRFCGWAAAMSGDSANHRLGTAIEVYDWLETWVLPQGP
jgi:hypothetical protein